MSTNFYWYAEMPNGKPIPCEDTPEIHIGLRATKFYWAQNPKDVEEICDKNLDKEIIQDEYLTKYTGAGFLQVVASIENHDLNSIGKHFC